MALLIWLSYFCASCRLHTPIDCHTNVPFVFFKHNGVLQFSTSTILCKAVMYHICMYSYVQICKDLFLSDLFWICFYVCIYIYGCLCPREDKESTIVWSTLLSSIFKNNDSKWLYLPTSTTWDGLSLDPHHACENRPLYRQGLTSTAQ